MNQPNPYAQQFPQPQPPAKPKKTGRKILFAALGLLVLMGGCSALAGGGDSTGSSPAPAESSKAPAAEQSAKPAEDKAKAEKSEEPKADATKVIFKVWGEAPAGALGEMDIMYGSDSDSRSGKGLPFEKSLPLDKDAMYYSVNAQLQGRGDIHCSVTIGDKTKKGHASGSYNICDAQINSDLFGGF